MKRILSLLAGAVVTGLVVINLAPQASATGFDIATDIALAQKNFEEQLNNLATLLAGTPVTANVKSINVAASGGFVCGADGVKSGDAKSIIATSTDGKSFIITAPGEDRLRTLMSTIEAAMLANLNVTFIANHVGCPENTFNAYSVSIAK